MGMLLNYLFETTLHRISVGFNDEVKVRAATATLTRHALLSKREHAGATTGDA